MIFPVHPRTRQRMQQLGLQPEKVEFLEPLGYLDFLALTEAAGLVLTDSGGIQEETTYLGVPCLTLRKNTERPVTVEDGHEPAGGERAQGDPEGGGAGRADRASCMSLPEPARQLLGWTGRRRRIARDVHVVEL